MKSEGNQDTRNTPSRKVEKEVPELNVLACEEAAAPAPNPAVMMNPLPDPKFARLDADLAGRTVIVYFETDPDDEAVTKRVSWMIVTRVTRMEIGMTAQRLNQKGIDWRRFNGIKAMMAYAENTRSLSSKPAPTLAEQAVTH